LKKGMRQLMLDLRQNPGGYVDAATAILDQFISKDKLLVYTQGRSTGKEEYIAAKTGKFEQGKLIVLVDETSASASEIVAGAVQDWDRGVIIGRRTYGKGLVQEQIELEDGSALRLTVAQYFTPSGRNIQRPFDKGKLAYEQDFETRYLNGSLTQKDTSINTDTTKYITAVRKRVVYGGGGIKPDIEVPYDVHQYSKTLYQYINADEFMNAVYTYFAGHSTTFNVYKSFNQFDASFNVSESVLQEIKKISEKAGYKHNLWEDTRDIAQLKLSIKAVIARMLFRSNGYFQEINKKDAMVNRALDIINSREYTAIIGG
jgi:carboxyl-terminal processing protease